MKEPTTLNEALALEAEAAERGAPFHFRNIRLSDRFLCGVMRLRGPRSDLRRREAKAASHTQGVTLSTAIALLRTVDEDTGVVEPVGYAAIAQDADAGYAEAMAALDRLVAADLLERLPDGGFQIMPKFARGTSK